MLFLPCVFSCTLKPYPLYPRRPARAKKIPAEAGIASYVRRGKPLELNDFNRRIEPVLENHFDERFDRERRALASVAGSDELHVDEIVFDIDDLQIAAVALKYRANLLLDRLLNELGALIRRRGRELLPRRRGRRLDLERRILNDGSVFRGRYGRERNKAVGGRRSRRFRLLFGLRFGNRDFAEVHGARIGRIRRPHVVDNILNIAAAGPARAARLERARYFVDRLEFQFANLAAQIRFRYPKALADEPAFVLVGTETLNSQRFHIDAPFGRPIEDGRFERLRAHNGAVNLLRREPFEIFDDILIRNFERLDRGNFPLFNNAAERFGGRDSGGASEGEELRFDDLVL